MAQGLAGWLGMQSNANTNAPQLNSGAFQYQGAGGQSAQQTQQGYQQQGAQAQGIGGPQIQNGYDTRDQAGVQGVLGSEGNLAQGYENLLNGQNSQATAQMNAATGQAIQAQMAMANSAKGSLAGAMAQRNAATQGSQELQNAAQQSAVLRAQEEQMALGGLSNLYANQGQLALGEQGLNSNQALAQAQLEEQQRGLNNQMTLGSQGMANQIGLAQLGANMQQQQLASGNQLASEQMGMQQGEFNAQQNGQLIGGLAGMAGGLMLAADADFEEPTPGIGRKGGQRYADMREPARITLREESTVDGGPFLAIADRNTGVVRKVATTPLSPAERARVAAPHGAGPLFADAGRAHTTVHDMSLAQTAGGAVGSMGGDLAGANVGSASPQMATSGPSFAHMMGGGLQGFGAGEGGRLASLPDLVARQRAAWAAQPYYPPTYGDLDLDADRAFAMHYGDAKLGTGTRFAHLEHQLAARPGVHNPGALAAYIGRQAHGAHEMAKLAAHGRK